MKARNWPAVVATTLSLTALLTLAADGDAPKATNSAPAPIVVAGPATVVVSPATNAAAPAVVVVTSNAAPASFEFPKLNLPPLLDQVVRLNQSGADEAVISAYIEKAAPAYQITGNEIIELQSRGVPRSVILSLIEHSKTAASAPATPLPDQQAAVAPPAAPAAPGTNEIAPGSVEAAADFQQALSPYGTWTDVPGYGYCWQPTVMVVNPSWRPYVDYGDWRWSDSGWYWNSYYSWGWAPFHYGRWFTYGTRGWYWCPDRTWGPAWVSWRNSASYCGWAPLPPGARFWGHHGWTYHGARVGIGFSFGLGAAHFTFVSHSRFAERHIGSHAVRGLDGVSHYRNTTVVNNYGVGPNNRIVNHGIGRSQIAAAAQSPIRQVSSQQIPTAGQRIAAPSGRNSLVRNNSSAVVGRATTARAGNQLARAPISQPASSAGLAQRAPTRNAMAVQRPVTPNYSQTTPRLNAGQPVRNFPAPAQRSMTAPRYQPRAPVQSFAQRAPNRSFAPAQAPRSFSPAPVQRFGGGGGRAMSSGGGGGQFRGAVSRGGGGGGNFSSRSFGARR